MTPFLKWPGGKRWLIHNIAGIMPQSYNKYIEPFLGGGAMFFLLEPNDAIISDINPDLINLYLVMRDNPLFLQECMREHHRLHDKEHYYMIRNTELTDPVEQAARFLYLNRTCYNGMYRVNRQGRFNVPIGTKHDCVYDIDLFQDYSKVLENVEIIVSDFALPIQRAGEGDLIFADPPYASSNKKDNGFLKYNDKLFTWDDQIRLYNELVAAKTRGASIILTNANCGEIKELYSDFYISEVSRTSSIASKKEKRTTVSELLITSFPQGEA